MFIARSGSLADEGLWFLRGLIETNEDVA